jgi:hypothetical protein
MMDARKIVLRDDLKLFVGNNLASDEKKSDASPSVVAVNVSTPNPGITTDEAIRLAQQN